MSIQHRQLDQLTEADLQSLIDDEAKEGRLTEYKETLPGSTESEKKEFLADVSSFSNAAGGDLIFGVKEKRDESNSQTGIPEKLCGLGEGLNLAQEQQRLESILQNGLDPRITGLRFKEVPLARGGAVLVMRVPQSWARPHRVCFQDWCRFYSRNSSGKYLLDTNELRSAFLQSQAVTERIRRFRTERISRILSGTTPARLIMERPALALHIVPIAFLDGGRWIDVASIADLPIKMPPIYAGGWNHRHNFDGFLTFDGNDFNDSSIGYAQLFRNGTIEAVTTRHFNAKEQLMFMSYEKDLLETIPTYLRLQESLGILPPLALMLSLVGVNDYKIAVPYHLSEPRHGGFDRDIVETPEILIEGFTVDLTQVLRPALYSVWNACGYPKSPNYDDSGNWRRLKG